MGIGRKAFGEAATPIGMQATDLWIAISPLRSLRDLRAQIERAGEPGMALERYNERTNFVSVDYVFNVVLGLRNLTYLAPLAFGHS